MSSHISMSKMKEGLSGAIFCGQLTETAAKVVAGTLPRGVAMRPSPMVMRERLMGAWLVSRSKGY
jgi:hypothetical protein